MKEYEFEAASVLVANCREIIPPFLRLRDGISPDDGVLDVVVLNASGLLETITVLWQLLIRSVGDDRRVRHIPGRVVKVESSEPRPVQLDGEAVGITPFTADVTPGGIRIMLPDG